MSRPQPLPEVIDSHAHVDGWQLEDQAFGLHQILARCERYGVRAVVFSLYCDGEGSLDLPIDSIERASRDHATDVRLSVGICPPERTLSAEALGRILEGAGRRIRELAAEGRIVAVGEAGLDHYWPLVSFLERHESAGGRGIQGVVEARREELLREPEVLECLESQKALFRGAARLARETGLPLVVHGRDAYPDILEILRESGIAPERVVLHCYAGSVELAEEAARRGHRISVPSSVGYREKFAAVARTVPLESMVIETDSPYHSPFQGVWKEAGRRAQELEAPAGLSKARRQSWGAERRREIFAEEVERRYPGLEFRTRVDGAERVSPGAEALVASGRRRGTNEPAFVRCAATEIARLRGMDASAVCEATTANARALYGI